ncbi:MAG: urea ABC transporter substrate-binding protein [Cyanobacteria bacterium J06649_5]
MLKGRQEGPISEEDGRGDRSSATDANRTLQTANGDGAPGMDEEGVIKIGLLHSLSGTMAISETALVDAEELAIEEINAAGGVLGRQIVAVLEDGASDWPTFTEKTEKLIEVNNVAAVFGCWTSASRKAVLSLFEDKNHMLWYPLAYEGQECSKNVFYTGAVPNQQLEPAINWLLENEKENAFFLVGAEDDFFRAANDIIQAQLKVKGTGETTDEATDEGAGEGSTKATGLAGEVSVPFGRDVAKAIAQIKADLPEGGIIINTLHGDDNVSFFRQLKRDGLEPEQYPVMSVSMAEEEIRQIGPEFLTGHYATWNYFQTVESETNDAWVANFKSAYGEGRVTSDPMAAAYTAVYLWKQAVEAAGTTNISAVREAAYGQTFEAPGGTVTLQPNHHLTKPVRIGKIREDGLFEIVWTTEEPIPPTPWNQYVADTKGYACDWSDNSKGGKYQPPATEKAEP